MTNPPKKIITPATLASLRQRFFRAQNSQHTALRCQPAPLRIPSRFPPAAPPHPPGKPPFLLIRFPLPSVARLRGALLGGAALPVCLLRSFFALASSSAVARSARRRFGLAAGAAPAPRCDGAARGSLRSHSSLALRAGGRRCRPARGSSLLRGRSPPLPSRWSLLSAPGAASLAAARLRSLPSPPLRARGRVRHLVFRRCGGVVGSSFLLRCCSRVARLVLLCVVLFLRSRLRRAFPAVAPSPPSLRFPASPWLSRCAPLPLAARFPPLRFGRSLAARSSCGGRALSPADVVCRRSCVPHCARSSAPPTRAAAAPRAGK